MFFEVEGHRVPVRIATRTLIVDGEPAKAKYDRLKRCIWISDQAGRHQRRDLLLHEFCHAWRHARGLTAADEESDADDSAEMMAAFIDQFEKQGGLDALLGLEPELASTIARPLNTPMLLTTAYCGYCGAACAVGSIGTAEPLWREDLGIYVVERGLWCELCDGVTVWCESSTPEGAPAGSVLPSPPPRVLTGADAVGWIQRHQGACRVRMAGA